MESPSPERYRSPERIRVSVSNLVHRVRIAETGETFQIAMRNKELWEKSGEVRWQALGGAAKMTPEGKQHLMETYGAEFGAQGRPLEEADDARFYVTAKQGLADASIAAISDQFSVQDPALYEADVLREAHEDLVGTGVLTEAEFSQVHAGYEGAVSPLPWSKTTSVRETGTPSRRIFHLFELTMPAALFEKLRTADSLHILTPDDVVAVEEAARRGEPAADLPSGGQLVENVFPEREP